MAPKRAIKKTPKALESAATTSAPSARRRIGFRAPPPPEIAAPAAPSASTIPANIALAVVPSASQAIASAALLDLAASGEEYVPRATQVRPPTSPPRRDQPIHSMTIEIRVYIDLEEVTSQAWSLNLFQDGRKSWLDFSRFADQAVAAYLEGEEVSQRIKRPNKWRGYWGAVKSRSRSDIFPVDDKGWSEFESILYIGRGKSAIVQVIYGLDIRPHLIPDISLDRPKAAKAPKVIPVKKVDMGEDGDDASKSKGRQSATTSLLAADAAEGVAMADTTLGVYRKLYERWSCTDIACPHYNKGAGGCWVHQEEHYPLGLRDLTVWARKVASKTDNCNLEIPYPQLKHQLLEQALKIAKRKHSQQEKRDNRREPSVGASIATPTPFFYHPPTASAPYWPPGNQWGGSPYYYHQPQFPSHLAEHQASKKRRRRYSSSSDDDRRANIKPTKWKYRQEDRSATTSKSAFDLQVIRDSSPLRSLSPTSKALVVQDQGLIANPTIPTLPSSPLRQSIDTNILWEDFESWLKERIPPNGWPSVQKLISVARSQEMSIEDLRTLNAREAKDLDILWGPLQRVKPRISEFKLFYKDQLRATGGALALASISEGMEEEEEGEDQGKEDFFDNMEEDEDFNSRTQNPYSISREGEGANYSLLEPND